MSDFSTHTCVSVRCGQCKEGYEDHEWAGVILFGSREEAVSTLQDQGWEFDGDAALCRRCARVAFCAWEGHRWDQWRRCLCGCSAGSPLIQDHVSPMECRSCDHCESDDERPVSTEGGASA